MTTREENRRRMPGVAKIFDEVCAVFGPGCKILYAKENGIEVGKKPDRSKYVVPNVAWEDNPSGKVGKNRRR